MRRYLDAHSTIVAVVTLILFLAALFVKGLTHDLFLEAGVFLVSAKILMMMHANHASAIRLESKLDRILSTLERLPRTGSIALTKEDARDRRGEE